MERLIIDNKVTAEILEEENKAIIELKTDENVAPLIASLKMDDKEIKKALALLLSIRKDREECKSCPGLGKCHKVRKEAILSLERNGKGFDPIISPCKKKEEQNEITRRYLICSFSSEWKLKGLRDIDQNDQRKPLTKLFVDSIKGKNGSWIYLHGKRNRGKSYMMALFANDFAKNRKCQVAFIDSATLIESLKDDFYADKTKTKFEKKLSDFSTVPLLILDDFGGEFISEFVFTTILYPLLNVRAKNGLITGFTSDFSLDEVISLYSSKVGPLRAKQLSSLLEGNISSPVELSGVDVYR